MTNPSFLRGCALASGALLIGGLLSGCQNPAVPRPAGAGPAEVAAPAAPPAAQQAPRLPVDSEAKNPRLAAWEGGSLTTADLGAWYLAQRPDEAMGAITRLIGVAVMEREAAAAGLVCPPEWLETRRVELLSNLEKEAALAFGAGTTVERFVRTAFQRSVPQHLTELLRAERERYLFSRLIRFTALREGRVTLSVVALSTQQEAQDAAKRLAAGADFGRLAARMSVLKSGAQGGRMAPLPPSALHPAVAARVSRLEVKERSGILDLNQEGVLARFWIVRLETREEPQTADFAGLAAKVEADLAQQPVSADEWAGWYRRIERLYKVRLSATFDRP